MKRTRGIALVLGASAAALVLLPLAGDRQAREGSTVVTIPDRLAGYSYLTASVSAAPTGRALALYQHGFGVEFMDYPQAVVLAADGDTYRRLDAAEYRGGRATEGDPGPMLLSPDGRSVALGDHDAPDPELAIVDLATGAVEPHPLPAGRSVIPLAWSPDGSRIAYLSREQPTRPYVGYPPIGDLYVLEVGSGTATPVPAGERTRAAAFSPDGGQLAMQGTRTGDLSIIDLDGDTARALPRAGRLAGPAAWSPDGRLLATVRASTLSFVDPLEPERATSARLALDSLDSLARAQVLGWTADREVALFDQSDPDVARLIAHPLDGGTSRELTRVENLGSFGVNRLQLASALLADVTVSPAGDPDRGPLPAAFRIALATAAGIAVAGIVTVAARRRRRG